VEHKAAGPMAPFSQYEHSSIPATVRKLFNLPSPHLTAREAWAGTFDHLVQTSLRTDAPGNCLWQCGIL
jgi:phospholipase C